MDSIYFLVRYIPFWGVPMLLLGAEFTYVAWLRKKKKWIVVSFMIALFSLSCLIFYYWAGGPEKSVQLLIEVVRYLST